MYLTSRLTHVELHNIEINKSCCPNRFTYQNVIACYPEYCTGVDTNNSSSFGQILKSNLCTTLIFSATIVDYMYMKKIVMNIGPTHVQDIMTLNCKHHAPRRFSGFVAK
jgi:hypothetical protein